MDNIRVMRLLIYEGPRDVVEEQVRGSLHGTKTWDKWGKAGGPSGRVTLRVYDLQDFPEVFTPVCEPLAFGEVDPRD
jgi:hypothetical protein